MCMKHAVSVYVARSAERKKGTKTTRRAYRNKNSLILYVGVSLVKLKTVFYALRYGTYMWYRSSTKFGS